MYLITNGKIITEKEILNGFDVLVEEDRISGIARTGTTRIEEGTEIIDARGGYVSPGFIDIHSDYIETMASPRPTALMDFHLSMRETEKHLIGHGITTMFHSLSFYKGTIINHKPIRDWENVQKLIEMIHQMHNQKHLVRHRLHARFEIDCLDEVEPLKNYMKEGKIHLVSFMDHTPGQGQYRNLEIYKKTLKGYQDLTDEEVEQNIIKLQTNEKVTTEQIKDIADLAQRLGIAVASHDDDTLEKLELVQSMGATISEFPITLEIAKHAKQRGMLTVAGAPNILLGGSHSGNLSAKDAILEGNIDILCSDYYPASLLHSVFIMSEQCGLDLVDMIKLVTLHPAKAVKMDAEIGSISVGKKADLLIIEKLEDGSPVITSCIVDGDVIMKTNYRI